MVFRITPREDKFFKYFNEMVDSLCEASSILKNFFETQADAQEKLELLSQVEHRGDNILAEMMKEINNSFLPPFDREDILLLTREMNSVLDHIQGTMEKVVIYKAGPPKDVNALKLVNVLEQAVEEMKIAVFLLPEIRTRHASVIQSCEIIRAYEQEGDFLYRAGVAKLFENTENPVEIIKWKEIYEHLEATLDDCERVSITLKGIAVKYV